MSRPATITPQPRTEVWESEGGTIAPEQLADSLGVVRHLTDTYSVGGYQYTNLTNAIAQARRKAKLEQAPL